MSGEKPPQAQKLPGSSPGAAFAWNCRCCDRAGETNRTERCYRMGWGEAMTSQLKIKN
jgi:hypothetical protein